MAGDLELELKLEAGGGELDALAKAPLLARAGFAAGDQVSTYFDTPQRELQAAGLSLRVRRIAARHVQTVKVEGTAAAGLFARPEWERDVADAQPVIDEEGPLTTLISATALASIQPIFASEVTRTTGLLEFENSTIEIVLDRGRVVAGAREAAVNEVELELKQGSPAALFSLARAMNGIVPLRLGVLAKSERGYRLADAVDRQSVKAAQVKVAPDMTSAQAFQAIAGACLRHFRLNEAILEQTDGAEALHQARVALRRLRSAFSIFKPVLADERFDDLRGELRWLAANLGEARDIDVLLERTAGAQLDRLRVARDQAYADVHAALSSLRARTLMIDLSEWIAIGRWRTQPDDRTMRDLPVDRFAIETLRKLRRRLKRDGRKLVKLSDDNRHEVRILAKKLRYASEFFVGIFSDEKARRRSKAFLSALADLQQHLGDLNDLAHGPSVLARLGIEIDLEAMSEKRRDRLLRKAAKAHEVFADAKPFWR
jgi:triphosphatase